LPECLEDWVDESNLVRGIDAFVDALKLAIFGFEGAQPAATGRTLAGSIRSSARSIGWLAVALTGSDTSSNVLFGGLQKITAEQLGLNPVLMAASNSSGGVMGKMIDAQSIVVASTETKW
jgi:L-lactate permease